MKYLRDGKWLTLEELKKYNENKKIKNVKIKNKK